MSDFSRDRLEGADEDRLPWLEAVEDEGADNGPGAGKLIAAIIAALVALGLTIGGIFWLRDRSGAMGGTGEIIVAPPGAYKEKPAAPGGMQVEGTGDIVYEQSQGNDVNSAIDLTAVPESPVTDPAAPPVIAAAPVAPVKTVTLPPSTSAKAPAPAATPPVKKPIEIAAAKLPPRTPSSPAPKPAAVPVVASGSGGGSIQLGAFSSEAKANAAWKSLAGRFSFLGGLSPSVTSVKSGANTLYRLRAGAAGQGGSLCAKLKVAGETCAVVN